MLINEEEMSKRLNNPLNLINRMRSGLRSEPRNNAMSLFIPSSEGKDSVVVREVPSLLPAPSSFNPFSKVPAEIIPSTETESVSSDDLIDSADSKVKLALAHNNAIELLNNTLDTMNKKLPEMKASALSSVANAASKVIESIRKERLEHAKNNKEENVHYHFYCPTQRKMDEYKVIEVS